MAGTIKMQITRELFEESGRRGGNARRDKLTPEERKRIARLAAQARWAKKPDAPDPTDLKGPKDGPDQVLCKVRKPCRQTGIPLAQPTLLEIPEAA